MWRWGRPEMAVLARWRVGMPGLRRGFTCFTSGQRQIARWVASLDPADNLPSAGDPADSPRTAHPTPVPPRSEGRGVMRVTLGLHDGRADAQRRAKEGALGGLGCFIANSEFLRYPSRYCFALKVRSRKSRTIARDRFARRAALCAGSSSAPRTGRRDQCTRHEERGPTPSSEEWSRSAGRCRCS